MKNLPYPDNKHLEAAEGWLELGNHLEANEELEKITPKLRAHPFVLEMRYKIYSKAKKWEMAAEVAKGLQKMLPDNPYGYFYTAYPLTALTLGNDGNLYGASEWGGTNNQNVGFYGYGTVFQVTTNGALTKIVSFANTNGEDLRSSLALGNDGNFYGTSYAGGSFGYGTVFQVTTNGTLTTLISFANTNGANPGAGLTLGNDGNFYGTTELGGSFGYGTIFQMETNGTLNTLVSFNNQNGRYPFAGLTLGNDGNFYGTTSGGGSIGYGTVFQVTTNGALTTLISFANTNGMSPQAALTLGNDGNFYGTASQGGSFGYGTVFRVLLSPIITIQPQSLTHYAGSTTTFTIVATNFSPLNYQWQRNGTNLIDGGSISGSKTNILTIAGISDSDAGYYSVIVSNYYGTLLSSNAALTVNDMPFIAMQPQSQILFIGSNTTLNVTAYGDPPFVFQWYFNGVPVGSPTRGTNVSSYTIADFATNQAGNYTVKVINGSGSVTSSNAVLTVAVPPVITAQPLSRTNNVNTTATFSVTIASVLPLSYQWLQNGTNLANGGKFSGATNSTLTITTVSSNEVAIYSVIVTNQAGSSTSSNASLTVNYLPSISVQPTSLLVLPGTNVAFGLSLNGTAPFNYNWRFNGTNILNATNASYSISPVVTNNAGNYSVVITNAASSVTSSVAVLTVLVSPTNQVKAATSNATFTVVAFNPVALAYQWQQNGTNLVNGGKFSGATASALTITGVSSNEAGIYAVTVTNTAGNVTSSNATLTVIYPPIITAQPLGQRILLGNGVAFNVAVSGTAPFNYQWRFNAGNLLNATNVIYAIPAVGTNHTGNYSVVVTNFAGSVTSSNALLVVLVPPSLALQLWAGYPLLNLNGMLSNNFTVQYSTDLTGTNWITLQTFSNLLTTPYLFLDPAGIGQPARFYRALMQ